jgi:hypothetical protein
MRIRTITPLIILATAVLLVAGCGKSWHRIEGNGNVVEEKRIMPQFVRVVNEGAFNVYIIQDTVSEIVIEAESNLIPHIRTLIKGNTLEIDTRDNLRPKFPINLYIKSKEFFGVALSGSGLIKGQDQITTPELELNLSGSGDIEVDVEADFVGVSISGSGSANMGVNANLLVASISGSGDMEFWGETDKGELSISGSGTFAAYSLVQEECKARISGSGDMFVNVQDYLDVTISGSGSVYYMGDPSVTTNITGSGSVIKP